MQQKTNRVKRSLVWAKGCKGKKPYATLGHALKAIERTKSHPAYDGMELVPYHCVFCDWYHFGHRNDGR